MKYSTFLIFLIYSTFSFGQNDSTSVQSNTSYSKFTLTFSTFNHAYWILNGTTTYKLTNTSIEVTNTSFGDKKGKVIFRKTFRDSLVSDINNIGLDSIEDFYFNYCVMVTSGNEYFISFKTAKMTKKVDLHHYYLKQVADMVNIINSQLPDKHKIHYLTRNTKQDCKLW